MPSDGVSPCSVLAAACLFMLLYMYEYCKFLTFLANEYRSTKTVYCTDFLQASVCRMSDKEQDIGDKPHQGEICGCVLNLLTNTLIVQAQ